MLLCCEKRLRKVFKKTNFKKRKQKMIKKGSGPLWTAAFYSALCMRMSLCSLKCM